MAQTPPCTHLEFVYTEEFSDSVRGLLDSERLRALESELLERPEEGAVIAGTGGVRKMRFALPGRGKRGSIRVLYVYVKVDCRIYFLLVYPKNVRDTLTQGEKSALRSWIETL